MKVAITGGHHSSALPVIKKLQEDGHEIVWIGHKFSLKGDRNPTLEFREITSLGIKFHNLLAGKFYKTYDPVRLLRIPFGFVQAFLILLFEKPKVILSFGGYLAVPVVVSGKLLRIPSVTHEQTLVTGYANKVISKFAETILVSWEESKKYFPEEKTIFSGLPLREEIFEQGPCLVKFNTGVPTIYITAGKTGSHKINSVVKKALPKLLEICNVIHQCGDHSQYNDYDELLRAYTNIKNEPPGRFYLKRFIYGHEIGSVFNEANLLVSRSGAHTISEIMALRKPALLIPIPWASHNEQMVNAQFVEKKGLARILEEKDMDPETFVKSISGMLKDIDNFKLKEEIKKIDSVEIIIDALYKTTKQNS